MIQNGEHDENLSTVGASRDIGNEFEHKQNDDQQRATN